MTIYFVQGENFGPVKIGYTSALDARDRLSQLQTGSPVRLVLAAQRPGSHHDERELHRRFAQHRLHGEWFTPTGAIERAAGVRLRRTGEALWDYIGSMEPPDDRPLSPLQQMIVAALRSRGDWASTRRIKRTLRVPAGTPADRSIGGTLCGLRYRGWLQSRQRTVWDGPNHYERRNHEWAHWAVNTE